MALPPVPAHDHGGAGFVPDHPGDLLDGCALTPASVDALFVVAANTLLARGADMATAQVRAAGSTRLVLVAYHGFPRPFRDHFAIVEGDADDTSCGVASNTGAIIAVPDVADDPVFNGTENQAVILESGSRAVTSFPVVADNGIAGVISAHYRSPGVRDISEGAAVARRLARQLAASTRPAPDYVRHVEEITQLREALRSRDRIGQAKGLLMAAGRLTDAEAFGALVEISQREHIKLRDVADGIVERHEASARAQRMRNDQATPDGTGDGAAWPDGTGDGAARPGDRGRTARGRTSVAYM